MGGVFIVEGMSVGVSEFSIQLHEDGTVTADGLNLSISYDASIIWAKIALEHRNTARAKLETRRVEWSMEKTDEDKRGRSLEEEFYATMQAVVASVTCIDALYDQLLPYAPITKETVAAWSRKKTARHKQIAETVRATFGLKPTQMIVLRSTLQAMFGLRDAAVHPSSKLRQPYRHPELDIATDWRLTSFRGEVGDFFVCFAVGLLWDITRGTKFRTPELTKFVGQLREKVDRLLPDGRPIPSEPQVTFTIPPRSPPPDDHDMKTPPGS